MYKHIPVLLDEVIDYLNPKPNHLFLDGTVGQGGHAYAFLQRALPEVRLANDKGPEPGRRARLLGFDRDQGNLAIARERLAEFGDQVVLVQDSYANAKTHAYAQRFTSFNAILLDLGFASSHIDDPERGFSFTHDGPLDMRYDQDQELSAEEIVNNWSEDELARIFRVYGEDRNARRIAKAIVDRRENDPIHRTSELKELVECVVPKRGKIHSSTKIFQALRIAVNDELGELERALPELVSLLASGGRIAIISFHSLEDRIVKKFFKTHPDLKAITKRPVTVSDKERKENPRARSAKLRVAEKV